MRSLVHPRAAGSFGPTRSPALTVTAALALGVLLTVSPTLAAAPDGDVEWDGIYADTTATFVQPTRVEAGGEVTLRLRAWADDLTGATCKLFYAGVDAADEVPMVREDRPAGAPFDYWRCTTRVPEGTGEVYFRFAVTDGADTDYYDAGAPEDDWPVRGMQDEDRGFQDFRIYTGLDTPVWSQGATFYQIFPDRFFDGRPQNNRLYPEDCIWYLDFAPSSPDAPECAMYVVPPTPEGWKRCEIHEDWAELPNGGPCDYFGGDLDGVTAKLPYLDDLAIDAVYLNPVFRSPSNHKYDTMDYDIVDPRFGGTRALDELTRAVHARDLKIIVDGVFNHVSDLGRFYNGWLNYSRANETSMGIDPYPQECGIWEAFFAPTESGCQDSPYSGWFDIWVGVDEYDVDRDGDLAEPATHTCGWAGLEFMPELDYGHPDFEPDSGPRTWLYGGSRAADPAVAAQSIAGRWLADGELMAEGLDGWRLDVPDNAGYFNEGRCNKTATDPTIWQGFRTAVKAVGDDKYISGEIWGDASESGGLAGDWFRQRTYDGVMNYHYFATPVSCLLTGMGVHADPEECRDAFSAMTPNNPTPIDAFDRHMARQLRVYPAAMVFSNQNLLSSHDSARFASRVEGDHRRLRLGMFMQSTLPGAPMIYYGDEIGIGESVAPRDATNEIGRATMPWPVFGTPSDRTETREYQRQLLCLRQQYAPLKRGSFTTLHTHNINGTYAYARFDERQAMAAAMNNSDAPRTIELNVRRLGLAPEVELVDVLTGESVRAAGHVARLDMQPYSGRLLVPADQAAAGADCRAPNAFPTADAGDGGEVDSGAAVMLDGSGSADPDGAPLSFEWFGPEGRVGDAETVRLEGLADGRYTFTLVVDDGVYRDRAEVTWIVGTPPDPEPEPGEPEPSPEPEPGEPEPSPEPGEPEPSPEPGEPEPSPEPGEPEPSPEPGEPEPEEGDMGVGADGDGDDEPTGCAVSRPGADPTPIGWLALGAALLLGLRRRR